MDRLPGVAVGDARAAERLEPPQEADARRLRHGVEVAGEDDVAPPLGDELLDELRRRDRLQLTFVLELRLPRRQVVDEQDRPDRRGHVDLGDDRRDGEVGRARAELLVELRDVEQRPAACDRGAVAVAEQAAGLVRDVQLWVEDLAHRVAVRRQVGLLEGDQVGLQGSTHCARRRADRPQRRRNSTD